MALYYGIVFALLATEMSLFAILLLPLPDKPRKKLLKAVSIPFRSKEFLIVIRCILGFVLLLFVDSINRLFRVSEAVEAARQNPLNVAGAVTSTTDSSDVQARKFYAQRNMYLCGFALFLHLILTQTYKLMGDLLEAKEALDESSHEQPSQEIKDLKKQLAEKEENIEILKSQSESLSKEYNSIEDSKKK